MNKKKLSYKKPKLIRHANFVDVTAGTVSGEFEGGTKKA
jgi:hypothetical protein